MYGVIYLPPIFDFELLYLNPSAPDRGALASDGEQMVSLISTQDMERYLEQVSSIDLSDDKKRELITIVHSITAHFVDQAFGVQTDQLSLKAQCKSRFQSDSAHASSMVIPTIETCTPPLQGSGNDSNFGRPDAP